MKVVCSPARSCKIITAQIIRQTQENQLDSQMHTFPDRPQTFTSSEDLQCLPPDLFNRRIRKGPWFRGIG